MVKFIHRLYNINIKKTYNTIIEMVANGWYILKVIITTTMMVMFTVIVIRTQPPQIVRPIEIQPQPAPIVKPIEIQPQPAPIIEAATTKTSQPIVNMNRAFKFAYQLQNVNLEKLRASDYSLVVIDNEHTKNEIKKLKSKITLAYVSLGEAEDYRSYWNKSWKKNPPVWLGKENPKWPGNYSIKQFWHPEWWKITKKILDDVIEKGYDGIAIDKVDVYEDLGGSSKMKSYMMEYIMEISEYAKSKNKYFKIIVTNSSELLKDNMYLSAIDGITQEDLIYDWNSNGISGTQTSKDYRTKIINNLKLTNAAGKYVMVMEYVSGQHYQKAKDILSKYDFSVYSAPRNLGSLR